MKTLTKLTMAGILLMNLGFSWADDQGLTKDKMKKLKELGQSMQSEINRMEEALDKKKIFKIENKLWRGGHEAEVYQKETILLSDRALLSRLIDFSDQFNLLSADLALIEDLLADSPSLRDLFKPREIQEKLQKILKDLDVDKTIQSEKPSKFTLANIIAGKKDTWGDRVAPSIYHSFFNSDEFEWWTKLIANSLATIDEEGKEDKKSAEPSEDDLDAPCRPNTAGGCP